MAIKPNYLGEFGITGGPFGRTGVYRVALADLDVPLLRTIAILDDGGVAGGTGSASGFDLDFVKISPVLTGDPNLAVNLPGLGAFSFGGVSVQLSAGFLQNWSPLDPIAWNTSALHGTVANRSVDFARATLATKDGSPDGEFGELALGEGGAVSFLLNPFLPNLSGYYL